MSADRLFLSADRLTCHLLSQIYLTKWPMADLA
jgi:hypothetical protein